MVETPTSKQERNGEQLRFGAPVTRSLRWIACALAAWFVLGLAAAHVAALEELKPIKPGHLAGVAEPPTPRAAQAAITSEPSTCMAIDGDGHTLKSAESKMLFVWEGTPSAARLTMTSCGVKEGKHHTVYVNGHAAVQVDDDPYSSACVCISEGFTGQGGQAVTYELSDPSIVVTGWNEIRITNDQDLFDDWVAYNAKLLLEGPVTQTQISSFGFVSSYDDSTRSARYQLPIGYDPSEEVPLLVSIGGTKEDQRWEDLYRFAMEANERGWLLLAPNLRNLFGEVRGRTASLENQHDIIDAIEYMSSHFAVDVDRIYMSGFSTGGGVAATVAAKYPHVFAAVADWAGPTDLGEWDQQVPSLENLDFGCWPSGFANPCPFEWQRRSVRSMSENLKHVPMAIVHGRADGSVPFEQSEKLYLKMSEYYDPVANNKMTVWHDGGHADYLSTFDGLEWMAQFTRDASPPDIMIRADEDKDYYWVSVDQRAWLGKVRDGWSAVLASYDGASGVISATVRDQRLYENGNLPLDVHLDLDSMGLEPGAGYTIEDHNLTKGDYVLRQAVSPVGNRLTLAVERDEAGGVHHWYLIYPFDPPELVQLTLQQHTQPDPSYAGVQDTYIYQYSPTDNYAAEPHLNINYGRSLRSLLKFDLGMIPPNADVKKAHLTLHLNPVSGSGSILTELHRVLTPWTDAEATWDQAAEGRSWSLAGAQGAGVDYDTALLDAKTVYEEAFTVFDLKPVLKDWLTGASINEGILILGPEIGSGSTRYRLDSSEAGGPGRRPKLEIWYMLATATPSPTPSPTPTATPTTPPQGGRLDGSVSLQGRPAPPNPAWSIPVVVTVGNTDHQVTTDQWGDFALVGLTPGVYDIRVKNQHTLRSVRLAVTLTVDVASAVDFGTLIEGDANDDNSINITDFSVLATGFYPHYDARADFNEDGQVNVTDFSLMASNFGLSGDVSLRSVPRRTTEWAWE